MLIMNMIMADRLVIVTNWKLKYSCQITEWYNEVWEIAFNNKSVLDIKYNKGLITENNC